MRGHMFQRWIGQRTTREPVADWQGDTLPLHEISTALIQQGNLHSLYDRVLGAAIELVTADMGSMQTFHPEQGELRLLIGRGFHPASASFWKGVYVHSATSCGMALSAGHRVVVPDVEACDSMAGTGDL